MRQPQHINYYMKNYSKYYGKELHIVGPFLMKRYYELCADDELLATLTFPRHVRSLAIVESGGMKWEIKKEKWWRKTLLIFEKGNEIPFAKAKGKIIKQTLVELPHGEKILLKFGWFSRKIMILTELENPIAEIKKKFGWKFRYDINVEYGVRQLDQYPWLVMLVLYIDLERRRRAVAVLKSISW